MWKDDISDAEFQRMMQAIQDRNFDSVQQHQQPQQKDKGQQMQNADTQSVQKPQSPQKEESEIHEREHENRPPPSPEYGAYGVVKNEYDSSDKPSYAELSTSGKFQAQQSQLRQELRRLKNSDSGPYSSNRSSVDESHHPTTSQPERDDDQLEQKRIEIYEKAMSLVVKDLKWRGASEEYIKNNMDRIEQFVKEFLGMNS